MLLEKFKLITLLKNKYYKTFIVFINEKFEYRKEWEIWIIQIWEKKLIRGLSIVHANLVGFLPVDQTAPPPAS